MNIDQLIPAVEERSQHAIGTELEKEHFRNGKPKDKTPGQVANTHLGENPRYYPTSKKPRGKKEAIRWVEALAAHRWIDEHCGHCPEDRIKKIGSKKSHLDKLFQRRPDLLAHPRM